MGVESARALVDDSRRRDRRRKRGFVGLTLTGGIALTVAWLRMLGGHGPDSLALLFVMLPVALGGASAVTLPSYALWASIDRVLFEAQARRLGLPASALRAAILDAPPDLEGDELYAFVDAQLQAYGYGKSL